MACSRTAIFPALAATLVLAGCASHAVSPVPVDPRAEKVCAALDSLATQKGFRAARHTVREGRPSEAKQLLLAPDYVHTVCAASGAAAAEETFVRGKRVVTRSSSGQGWLLEEIPTDSDPSRADLDAVRTWARAAPTFAEPRRDAIGGVACDLYECVLNKDAISAVNDASKISGGSSKRTDVAVWIGPDGLPRRARLRYDGPDLQEIDMMFSDFGIDADPALPDAVKRLLWQ